MNNPDKIAISSTAREYVRNDYVWDKYTYEKYKYTHMYYTRMHTYMPNKMHKHIVSDHKGG